MLDGQVTSTFTFAEGTDADDAVTQYVCVPLSDGSILLVELSYYVAAEETAGQALQEMLRSITFSTPGKRPAVQQQRRIRPMPRLRPMV